MNLSDNSNGSNRPGGFNRNGRDAGGGGAMAERAMRGTSNVHEFRPVIGKDGKYAIGKDGRFGFGKSKASLPPPRAAQKDFLMPIPCLPTRESNM